MKKLISFFLCVILLFSAVPVTSAHADKYESSIKVVSHDSSSFRSLEQSTNNVSSSAKGRLVEYTIDGVSNYHPVIYIPKAYDNSPNSVFNVLIYLGGIRSESSGSITDVDLDDLLDYMFSSGTSDPFIFVSFGNNGFQTDYVHKFLEQIRNDSNYRVYGNVYKPKDDIVNHYAICGYSMGALNMGYYMPTSSFEGFSAYGFLSCTFGDSYYPQPQKIVMNKVQVLFSSAGTDEGEELRSVAGSKSFLSYYADVTDMSKIQRKRVEIQGGQHGEKKTRFMALYEYAPMLFKGAVNNDVAKTNEQQGFEHEIFQGIPENEIGTTPSQYCGTTVGANIQYSGSQTYPVTIYTPYDYDTNTSKIYNVVVYVGGSGQTTTFAEDTKGKQTLDYICWEENVGPFIFVSLAYSDTLNNNRDKIINSLVTYLQDNYRVYGQNYQPTDEVRNHYAFCGYSSGAWFTQLVYSNEGVYNLFGSYGLLSPQGTLSEYSINQAKDLWNNSGQKIKLLFASAGSGDESYATTTGDANEYWAQAASVDTLNMLSSIADNRSYWHFTSQDYKHGTWQCSCAGVYRFILELLSSTSGTHGTEPIDVSNLRLSSIEPDEYWWYNANCIFSVFSVYYQDYVGLTKEQSDIMISGMLGVIQCEAGLDPSCLEGFETHERYGYSPDITPQKWEMMQTPYSRGEFYHKVLESFRDRNMLATGATCPQCGQTIEPGEFVEGLTYISAPGYLCHDERHGGQNYFMGGIGYIQWTSNHAVRFLNFCEDYGLNWASPEANLIYMLVAPDSGGERNRIDMYVEMGVPSDAYTAGRNFAVLEGVDKENRGIEADHWYVRMTRQENINGYADNGYSPYNILHFNRSTGGFSYVMDKDYGPMVVDTAYANTILAKVQEIQSGEITPVTPPPSTYTPTYGDLYAFSSDIEMVSDSFADVYGWNRNYIHAAEWTRNSTTYRRPQGHEAELFEDSLYAAEDTCVDLGILPKAYHTTMGSGSLSMVGVALREAGLGKTYTMYDNKYVRLFSSESHSDPSWSTQFVAWCANECGYIESGLFSSTSLVNKSFDYQVETNGFEWFDAFQAEQFGGDRKVEAGDLFYFERQLLHDEDLNTACNGVTYGRVGIVTSVTPTAIFVTEGAVENKVATIEYTKSDFETILSVNHGAIIHVEYPVTVLVFEGERIDIPIDDGYIYNYEGWQNNTAESRQLDLRRATGDPFDAEGFGCINGRYVVACTDTFGSVGDYVDFYLDDGQVIPCVIGDIKSRGDWNWCEWGHKKYTSRDESSYFGVCVLEFCVNNPTIENPNTWNQSEYNGIPNWYYQPWGQGQGYSHANPGTAGCHPEWQGHAVKYAIRGGNYFYDPTGETTPGALAETEGELTQAQQDIVNFAIRCYETNGGVLSGTGYEVGCAGFCMRVYWYAPHGDGSGSGYQAHGWNAIDYWREYGNPSQATRESIPVGAFVVSAAGQPSDGNGGRYGHVGIYIGNGEVIHYSGRVWRHSLANFIGFCGGSGAWTIADDGRQYHGYQGWVWPCDVPLGTYKDRTGLSDP